ncbi:MAG TPA: rod-binding protein [Mobilitalea sp.]|nr:rod-binding protein [Mobilitalea sp.]
MDISIGSGSQYYSTANTSNSAKTDNIESTLKNSSATDEELMNACKSFESYLLEQVFKGMEKTVMKSDEEEQNDYLAQFGDKLYEEYADSATENQGLGIAQMLYDSMKRN